MRTRPQTFEIGSIVWCLVPKRVPGRYQKWRSQYEGPFKVIARPGPVTYLLQRPTGGRIWTAHVDKLKAAHVDTEEDAHLPRDEASPSVHTEGETTRPRRNIRLPFRFR